MKKMLLCTLLSLFSGLLFAHRAINLYIWGGEIPKQIIQQFEKETGIRVNFSSYDSNETMYAKLKASNHSIYDVILPSGHFVERMIKRGMLSELDLSQLPNHSNLDSAFANHDYDPGNRYSIPLLWGTTGLFFNQDFVKKAPEGWLDLWKKQWRGQLMLLDDAGDVFAVSLMSLGHKPNDTNPEHIAQAYYHLMNLVPNIKLFASDSVQAIIIDEDAIAGLAWNGDAVKAKAENKAIAYQYPKEGFIIWVDCLAIPKNPPHPKEAYAFINYMLKPEIAAQLGISEGYAITNVKGRALLPENIQSNQTVYPSTEILSRGYFQRDVDENTRALFSKYWQRFKLAF